MGAISLVTRKKKEVIPITHLIEEYIAENDVQNGVCTIFVLHTTCAITTADLDPGTDLDMLDAFEAMIPKLRYRHPHDPSHVPDHIMSSLIGPSLTCIVENGRLTLGTWQEVILVELDGPRTRDLKLHITQ